MPKIQKNHDIKQVSTLSQNLSTDTLMMQMQIMMAKDFDDQLRHIGDQVKFLNDLKKSYRQNINTVQQFMAKNPNTSRKDGKKYYEASFEEMANLYGSFVEYDYNLESLESKTVPMTINDKGEKHSLDTDTNKDGDVWVSNDGKYSSTKDWKSYFEEGSKITDPNDAFKFADKVGDDDGNLPFYFGHKNNRYEDGSPKFAVFSDSLDKMLEQIKNYMSDVEEDGEQLSVKLNQLTNQRKAALDGANQLIRKLEEMKSNTISKMT